MCPAHLGTYRRMTPAGRLPAGAQRRTMPPPSSNQAARSGIRTQRQKSAAGVARHRPGERESIGSVATRALTEFSVEREFLTDDPVAQAARRPRVLFGAAARLLV